MNRFLIFLTIVISTNLVLSSDRHAVAGGSGEQLVLVVNRDSIDSLTVANHYIRLRNLPSRNVIYVDNIPSSEDWTLAQCKAMLRKVIATIEKRKLFHIDYLVYSAGFPTRVNTAADTSLHLKQFKRKRSKVLDPEWSSLNAITYFAPQILADDTSYMTLDSNWYMRFKSADLFAQPFVGELQKDYQKALRSYEKKQYAEASAGLKNIVKNNPGQVAASYLLARSLVQQGKTSEATLVLYRAVKAGWCYRTYTEKDPDLEKIRKRKLYQRAIAEMADYPFGWPPTRSFSRTTVWGPNGWPNGTPSQGKRFMLSAVLAVTGDYGTTLAESISQLRRTVGSDGTQPTGKFFFAMHGDVRSTTREPLFQQATEALEDLGLEAEMVQSHAPQNWPQVAGATLGSAKIDWQAYGSKFAPGAICDNLTSYGGFLSGQHGQTPLTDFLKAGAAAASGTVSEPHAIASKFPQAMLHVHYARGCSLAEAFYQSVHSPRQLLIVGDPLCQPWADFPRFTVKGLSEGQVVEKDLALQLHADPAGPKIARYELFLDGLRVSVAPGNRKPRVNLKFSGVGAGYHRLRVVAVSNTLIATRYAKTFGFYLGKEKGNGVVIRVDKRKSKTLTLSDTLIVSAQATFGDEIAILQNLRVVAKIPTHSGQVRIPCKLLGMGQTTLRAVAHQNGMPVSSLPVDVEIAD